MTKSESLFLNQVLSTWKPLLWGIPGLSPLLGYRFLNHTHHAKHTGGMTNPVTNWDNDLSGWDLGDSLLHKTLLSSFRPARLRCVHGDNGEKCLAHGQLRGVGVRILSEMCWAWICLPSSLQNDMHTQTRPGFCAQKNLNLHSLSLKMQTWLSASNLPFQFLQDVEFSPRQRLAYFCYYFRWCVSGFQNSRWHGWMELFFPWVWPIESIIIYLAFTKNVTAIYIR